MCQAQPGEGVVVVHLHGAQGTMQMELRLVSVVVTSQGVQWNYSLVLRTNSA